jgi:hypothetical protein
MAMGWFGMGSESKACSKPYPMQFCLTHSSRPMDFSRCSLNYLTQRYRSPVRLANPPPLESLGTEYSPTYIGNVTVWSLDPDPTRTPELVSFVRKDYKAQHALVQGDRLIICGTAFLEVCDLQGNPGCRFSDGWFAGAHTVFPTASGKLAVACSASDALLVFDLETRDVTALRIPEGFYGHNYQLSCQADVRAHYIHNDLQRTHINCGVPFEDGFLVSMLIPGAVGRLSSSGDYEEITSGFVGCHGARTRPGQEGFYFTDSCSGTLIEMSRHGRIQRRFSVESRWLHDCEWLADDLYLFSIADTNRLELWDVNQGHRHWSVDMSQFGNSTQFTFVC